MAPTLLSLPVELRELIYQQLFGSYNINHGFHSSSTDQHRIALLQTCRQIYNEAWRHLPLNCTLQFYGTENLLDTLMSADQSIVTRIRHICVKSFPFPLYGEGRPEHYPTYYLANALSLLPGLNLDTLVVYDSWHGGGGLADGWRDVVAYTDFESLMNADGWRELTYITPNTDFLTSGYDHRKLRVMQPDGWNSAIKERDGKESGAEVKMYIVLDRQQDAEGDSRTEHGKIMQPWSAQPGHEVIENWRIATPQQDWKGQVRIISKRGKRVSVAQKGMREKKTWKELKGEAGTFRPTDWKPYYHDMADAVGWMYGGWGRRMQMASRALNC